MGLILSSLLGNRPELIVFLSQSARLDCAPVFVSARARAPP
jgi:hypothetical protein